MIEVSGKYTDDVKVFVDTLEDGCLDDIQAMADCPAYKGKKLRFMPDTHKGVHGACIGFSCPIDIDDENEMIAPAIVGADEGCTVSCKFYDRPMPQEKMAEFEHKIRKELPFGVDINDGCNYIKKELKDFFNKVLAKFVAAHPSFADYVPDEFHDDRDIGDWLEHLHMDDKKFWRSVPSVGSGNHFIEYDENESEGKYAVCVHCGSRNLGQKVFKYWDSLACGGKLPKDVRKRITKEVKAKNTDPTKLCEELDLAFNAYKEKHVPGYLNGEDMKRYLVDVLLCQAYAAFNHVLIHEKIAEIYEKLTGGKPVDIISTTHNYVDFDFQCYDGTPHVMIRKGAVRAYEQERLIIPFNMRDGIAICKGNSNPDYNFTAPHGAGRSMSRKAAFEKLNVDDFKKEMADAGIYTTTADDKTLDEAPEAYKPKEDIIRLIEPTATVLYFMKPKMNIKAAEDFSSSWRKKKS